MAERQSIQFAALLDGDDDAWAGRSELWSRHQPKKRGPGKKYKFREPLILCGHGIRLRVDHGTLLIRNGFTHYPQEREEIRIFPGDANLPNRIIILDGNGGISFDALSWMSEQKIDFVRLDWRGRTTSVGGVSGYAANPRLAKAQHAIIETKHQIEIARWLIAEKFDASISTLRNAFPESDIRKGALDRIKRCLSEVRNSRKSCSIARLLGLEGDAAAAYFMPWRGLPIRWTSTKRRPIPNDWFETVPRTMGWRKRVQSARHPINAMLNYGYGLLANQMRAEVITAGLDPSIGLLHHNKRNPVPLVYDLMEPLRPVVDKAVLEFALSHTFAPGDFTIAKWGGCRLNPQLARAVVSAIPLDFFGMGVVTKFVVQIGRASPFTKAPR